MSLRFHRRNVIAVAASLIFLILLLVWFGGVSESMGFARVSALVLRHGGVFSRERMHVGEPGLNPNWTWVYRVDLSGRPISDDVAQAILHQLDQLQYETVELNLKGTRITDALVPHVKAIHSLESIDVSGTAITPAGLAELRRNSPPWRHIIGDPGAREIAVNGVEQLRFSSDGQLLAIVSRIGMDLHVEVWQVDTRQKLSMLSRNVRKGAITFSPDSTQLAVANVSSVMIIDPRSGKVLDQVDPPRGLEDIAYSADGQALHVQTWDGFFSFSFADRLFQPLGGRLVRRDGTTHFLEKEDFTAVTDDGRKHPWEMPPFLSMGGEQVAMAGDGESLVRYDWYADEKQGSVLLCRRNPASQLNLPVLLAGQPLHPVGNVVFNWSSQRFAFPTEKMITIWSVETGQLLATHHLDFVPRAIAFSADGKTLAVGGHRLELLDAVPE